MNKKLLSLFIVLTLIPFNVFAVTLPEGRALSGDLTITAGTTRTEDSVKSNITVLTNSSYASTTLASVVGFSAGDYVMLYQAQGTGAGNYEIKKVGSIVNSTLLYTEPLTNTYQSTKAFVLKINEYHNVTVNSGGKWTASAWDGTTGGILIALLNGTFTQNSFGTTTVQGLGFSGGSGPQEGCSGPAWNIYSYQGDSSTGNGASAIVTNNGMGGGAYGGGGGYGTNGNSNGSSIGGVAGGVANLSSIFFGGGGGGGPYTYCGYGGTGGSSGGIIFISSTNATLNGGLLSSNGNNGGTGSRFPSSDGGDGAGGAGGSIYLPTKLTLTLGTGYITSNGGTVAFGPSGAGGVGRIATLASTTVTGTSNPSIGTSTDTIINKDNEAQKMILGFSM